MLRAPLLCHTRPTPPAVGLEERGYRAQQGTALTGWDEGNQQVTARGQGCYSVPHAHSWQHVHTPFSTCTPLFQVNSLWGLLPVHWLVHSQAHQCKTTPLAAVHVSARASALADASNVCTLSSHRVHRDLMLHAPGERSCLLVHSRLKRGHQAEESALASALAGFSKLNTWLCLCCV